LREIAEKPAKSLGLATHRAGDGSVSDKLRQFHKPMGFAEECFRLAPLDFLTADKVFDAQWAMTLMDEAMGRVRQEYAGQGKTLYSKR
jgi:hypothetical protein